MGKTLYTAVQGLEPFGGTKPVGVQVRVKGGTGPYVPRFIEDDEGVILIVECTRGDLTLKELDGNKVVRIDLDATEILEWTDKDAAYDAIRAMRGERDRARSEASGYDGTFDDEGRPVHVDGDGTVLTAAEVAALRGVVGPTVEEAEEWWSEQQYLPDTDGYEGAAAADLVDVISEQGAALSEVEYIRVLEHTMISPRSTVLAAIEARMVAHVEVANAPGLPLEDGLGIAEVRRRLETIGDVRVVQGLLDAERAGKGRKRVVEALERRLEVLETLEPMVPVDEAEADAVEVLAEAPPLPGEDEGAVTEEPFG